MSNEEAKHLHSVEWSEGVAKFRCAGDRTSPCHNFPDCECEMWSADHHEQHPDVVHDAECWVLPWLENIEVECTWEGGEGYNRPAEHDGPITTVWDSEQILWDYADPELAVTP